MPHAGLLLPAHHGCLQKVGQHCLTPADCLLHQLGIAPVNLELSEHRVPALPGGIWYLCDIWELWNNVLRQRILQAARLRVGTSRADDVPPP